MYMNTFENTSGPEIKKKEVHWAHPCQSCHLEGSTTFTEEGVIRKMDVYSCSSHVQPGIMGTKDTKFEGERIVVRYSPSTNHTIGEISFDRSELDIETLRSRARNRQGKSNYTPPKIAIGKVL
jgi:hypothetical protein